MKSKKTLIVIAVVAVIILAAALIVPRLLNKDSFGLKKSGSFYENMSDFALSGLGDTDEITKAFLKGVQYEITSIDKENMTATVDVSVPDISNELSIILDNVTSENSEKSYEEQKQIAESKISSMLSSNNIETVKSTVNFQIVKVDGSYKLGSSEEWNRALVENLENLYISYLKTLLGGMTDETP